MIKRIAVLNADGALCQALSSAAQGRDAIIVAVPPGETPPPGAVMLATGSAPAETALNAALAAGAEPEGLLVLLADAVACREGIPEGSSERVRCHASRFARALGLSMEDQFSLERAALLRDIGKIRIPNDILLKKSVLDYDEWTLLHSHAALGAELLAERGLFCDVLDAVRYHHECYDGTGYPEHLEKDAIPLPARIMKILDVYCAMTSPRHYRPTSYTHEDAVVHLNNERGKHFDPRLVDVFIEAGIGVNGD